MPILFMMIMLVNRGDEEISKGFSVVSFPVSPQPQDFLEALQLQNSCLLIPNKAITLQNLPDTTDAERSFLQKWSNTVVYMQEQGRSPLACKQEFLRMLVADNEIIPAIESMEKRLRDKGLSNLSYWYAIILSQMAETSYSIQANAPEEDLKQYLSLARVSNIFLSSFTSTFQERYKQSIHLSAFRVTFQGEYVELPENIIAVIRETPPSSVEEAPIGGDHENIVTTPYQFEEGEGDIGYAEEEIKPESLLRSWKRAFEIVTPIIDMTYRMQGARFIKWYVYKALLDLQTQQEQTLSINTLWHLLQEGHQALLNEIRNPEYHMSGTEDGDLLMNSTILQLTDGNIVILGFSNDNERRLITLTYIEGKNEHIGKRKVRRWVQSQSALFEQFDKNDFPVNTPPAFKNGKINREFIQKILHIPVNDYAEMIDKGYIKYISTLA